MMPLNSKRWCRCVILIHRTSTLLTSQPTKRMEVAVLQHSCCISHWCASAQGGGEGKRQRTPEETRGGSPGLQAHCWEETGLSKTQGKLSKRKKKKKNKKGKAGDNMQLWELRDAALLLGQSRSPLPRGCCAAAPKAAATAHCWDAAQPQQLQGQGAALQLSEAVLCQCIEIRAKRFGVLCGFFLLLLPEIHQDLSSLLYFSAPSCDVNTYAGIHLHFKRTSSHGVRATGCFSRCCRPRWLSLRKKN